MLSSTVDSSLLQLATWLIMLFILMHTIVQYIFVSSLKICLSLCSIAYCRLAWIWALWMLAISQCITRFLNLFLHCVKMWSSIGMAKQQRNCWSLLRYGVDHLILVWTYLFWLSVFLIHFVCCRVCKKEWGKLLWLMSGEVVQWRRGWNIHL